MLLVGSLGQFTHTEIFVANWAQNCDRYHWRVVYYPNIHASTQYGLGLRKNGPEASTIRYGGVWKKSLPIQKYIIKLQMGILYESDCMCIWQRWWQLNTNCFGRPQGLWFRCMEFEIIMGSLPETQLSIISEKPTKLLPRHIYQENTIIIIDSMKTWWNNWLRICLVLSGRRWCVWYRWRLWSWDGGTANMIGDMVHHLKISTNQMRKLGWNTLWWLN